MLTQVGQPGVHGLCAVKESVVVMEWWYDIETVPRDLVPGLKARRKIAQEEDVKVR